MKTLLIIGGSGFFGKSILDSFHRGLLAPWEITKIVVVSRNPEQLRKECPQLISDRVELFSADITVAKTLPRADIVIHAAASTDAAKYQMQGVEECRNIEVGTENFCRLVPQLFPHSQILFVSSGAVYGNQSPDLDRLSEQSPMTPIDRMSKNKRAYAKAKRAAEFTMASLYQQGFNISIVRCFAFVGPWLPRDQHFAIGNFIANGLRKEPIIVQARHAVYRSYMHADDLVEWLLTIVTSKSSFNSTGSVCPVYNVGSDQAILIGDLAALVAEICQVSVSAPALENGHVDRYVPEITAAVRDLGLQIKIDLRTAVVNTLAALKERA